jgi:hypothetical protein
LGEIEKFIDFSPIFISKKRGWRIGQIGSEKVWGWASPRGLAHGLSNITLCILYFSFWILNFEFFIGWMLLWTYLVDPSGQSYVNNVNFNLRVGTDKSLNYSFHFISLHVTSRHFIFPWFSLGVSIIFWCFSQKSIISDRPYCFNSDRNLPTLNYPDSSFLILFHQKNTSKFWTVSLKDKQIQFISKQSKTFHFSFPDSISCLSPFSGTLSPHWKGMRSISRTQIW